MKNSKRLSAPYSPWFGKCTITFSSAGHLPRGWWIDAEYKDHSIVPCPQGPFENYNAAVLSAKSQRLWIENFRSAT